MRAPALLFLFSGACRVLDACPDSLRPDGEGGCVYVDDPTEALLAGTYGTGDLGWTEDPYDAAAFNPSAFGIEVLHSAIDWRSVDGVAYVTAVADQGPYATDVFFASTAAIESAALIQGSGALAADTLDLSEQYRLDCSDATIDGYTLAEVTNDWADGTVDEAERAYTGLPSGGCPPASTGNALEAVYLVAQRDLKAALHLGPVLTRFDVYENFAAYDGGIYTVEGAATPFGHAVLIVGYDDHEQYWIVKNSWGPGWGEEGYVRVAWNEPDFAEQGLLYVVSTEGAANGLEILRYGDCIDADNDGWAIEAGADCPEKWGDCDDGDRGANPGRGEECDEIDNDCDGEVNEGTLGVYYVDADGDGSGDGSASAVPVEGCSAPAGYAPSHDDCDDTEALVRPGLPEVCDGLDNDCSGVADRPEFDLDNDRWTECEGDCDDSDGLAFPGAAESCREAIDRNCDGALSACLCDEAVDSDGDGCYNAEIYAGSEPETVGCPCPDRTDDDPTVYSGAPEVCDYKDNDEDAAVDEGVLTTFWLDADDDAHGDEFSPVEDCSAPIGYVLDASDCDDTDELDYPGADEICQPDDGSADQDDDENCEENGDDYDLCDLDGDGWDSGPQPFGDCDETDTQINPGIDEACDGVDNDCDGSVDEPDVRTDLDGDGFACDDDCDDTNAAFTDVCGLLIYTEDVALTPGQCSSSANPGCTTTIELPPDGTYSSATPFLAPYAAIEHDNDQCDYKTTITVDTSGDPDVVTFEHILEHCGTRYGAYGYQAKAVVVIDVLADTSDGWVVSCEDTLSSGDCPASLPASADVGEINTFCAVRSFDDNGSTDTSWGCTDTLDAASNSITGAVSQGDGDGTVVEADIFALATAPNVTAQKETFDCNFDGSGTVSHAITREGDHLALVLPRYLDMNAQNHSSWLVDCHQEVYGGNDYYDCDYTCFGSGGDVGGDILFLDGDFQ